MQQKSNESFSSGKCLLRANPHFFSLFFTFTYLLFHFSSFAQCPPNIDFEKGNFNGWKCYIGTTEEDNGQNFIYLTEVPAPIDNRHVMYSSFPGDGVDTYGGFPKNCPNGSGHSVRLGNDIGSAEAEGLSYEFTIPVAANQFRLTYNYAVVIEDPGHLDIEQPRMQIEIFNVTDNRPITCSSFDFIADNSLPGFQISSIRGVGNCPILYRNWSANTINLDGLNGKTIRFFVKTADCTFNAHFGYAYIDVMAECSNNLAGAIYCSADTALNITAPFGYQSYNWLESNLTHSIGDSQVLHVSPPPLPGTVIAVELTPYPGYGCIDTILQVIDTIHASADAGPDRFACNHNPVQIGGASTTGLMYSWSPSIGLSNAAAANPEANPDQLTDYHLTVSSAEGGCISSDIVRVTPRVLDPSLLVNGRAHFCLGNSDGAVLQVFNADSVVWYQNNTALSGIRGYQLPVTASGNYYAMLYDRVCTDPVTTTSAQIQVDTAKPGIRYPDLDIAINFPVRLPARNFGDQYVWSPATQLNNTTISNPFFRGANNQLYKIEIRTDVGCVTIDTQWVRTFKKIDIYVPTAFTPNGDGLNDYLHPLLQGFKKVNYFRIYNRWGNKLFESNTDIPGWDGKTNKMVQEPQTVIWMIEAVDIDGKVHQESGKTILLP